MTTLQVHLLMLALGLLAFWLLAGLFRNRKSRSSRLRRQWWLGALAAIAVAASPLSRFWRTTDSGIELLTQSMLISAICLFAFVLMALVFGAFKALGRRASDTPLMINGRNDSATSSAAQPSLTPITINADASNTSDTSLTTDVTPKTTDTMSIDANNAVTQIPAATIDKSAETTDVSISDTQINANDGPATIKLASDQEKITQRHVKDIESVVPLNNKHDATQTLDESISSTSAANDNDGIDNDDKELSLVDNPFDNPISDTLSAEEELDLPSIPGDTQRLDLSETEQLFAEIRGQQHEVELPDDEELRLAKQSASMDELDLDTQLDLDTELVTENETTPAHKTVLATAQVEIEEAEVVDIDDTDLEFGNDLTGEYSHPAVQKSATVNQTNANDDIVPAQPIKVPETLDEALIAAKISAVSLQTQVSALEDNITELDKLRDSTLTAANENISGQQQLLEERAALLESEDKARLAAESVIAAQSALIDRAKRQQAIANTLLIRERDRLNSLQQEIARSRKMARTAANLARRAAIAQQESRDVALREQNARLKSQESTRKAVTIARNAISALAAEERKRGITRH